MPKGNEIATRAHSLKGKTLKRKMDAASGPGSARKGTRQEPSENAKVRETAERIFEVFSDAAKSKSPFSSLAHLVALTSVKKPCVDLDRLADVARKRALRLMREVSDFAFDMTHLAALAESKVADGGHAWARLAESADDSLGLLARDSLHSMISHRARVSRNTEVLIEATSDIHATQDLLVAVRRYFDICKRKHEKHETLCDFAEHVWWLVWELADWCDKCPEAFKDVAGDFPCWPKMEFARPSAGKDFNRLAEDIGLGKRSVVNAASVASYRFSTSINRYVFALLYEISNLVRQRGWHSELPIGEALKDSLRTDYRPDGLAPEELPIIEAAKDMKSLRKNRASAVVWADKVLMPLIDIRHPDFATVSEFKTALRNSEYPTRGSQRKAIRNAVIESLLGMAKPGR